jgi:hypothetical protein
MRRLGFGFVIAVVTVCVWVGGVERASATMPMQKKAKELGFDATNCQYCHVDKLPKKEAHALNPRGQWLVDEKDRQKAKEIDVSWLKNYVEGSDTKK